MPVAVSGPNFELIFNSDSIILGSELNHLVNINVALDLIMLISIWYKPHANLFQVLKAFSMPRADSGVGIESGPGFHS